MLNRLTPALSCAAWLAAGAALAQPASTTVAPVTVQGLANPAMIEEQARSFVQSHAAVGNPEINQIGRWHEAVCVAVVGLPRADQAAVIKARIEGVAHAVGLPAARPGCAANVEIVFNPEPQHVMDLVAKRREYLLGYYHFHDRDRLKTVSRPIQSWYVTSTSSFTGSATAAVTGVPLVVRGQPTHAMGVIDDPENGGPSGCADTPHFTACLTSAFENVFIVADSKALEGKTLSQVADDMAVLALSKPRNLDGCNALPSVTDAFAKSPCPGRDAPDSLTAADASYLTALYASDPEAFRQFAQSDIARRMATILIKANAVAR
jgi:hypothetical protein